MSKAHHSCGCIEKHPGSENSHWVKICDLHSGDRNKISSKIEQLTAERDRYRAALDRIFNFQQNVEQARERPMSFALKNIAAMALNPNSEGEE